MIHPALAPGKIAVITGAADGIGLAAAHRFASMGMTVVLSDRDADKLSAARNAVGGSAIAVATDVSDRAAVNALAAQVTSDVGPVSVLMNNAGTGRGGNALSNPKDWDRVIGTNLMGTLYGVQAFVPAMVAGDAPGLVINTGSKQGITQPPGDTAYNVSKSGVKSLTEGLAHTLREETGAGKCASPYPRFHLHRYDESSFYRKARRRLDPRAGGRCDDGWPFAGRFLFMVSGQ